MLTFTSIPFEDVIEQQFEKLQKRIKVFVVLV